MKKEDLIKLKSIVSPTFCMAKFHEATIWLYSGKIASCHHTPLVPIGRTPKNLFNPLAKRIQQDKMLKGEKPEECNYCWKLEEKNLKSDREFKSLHFKDSLPPQNYLDRKFDFKPKALELAFSNVCNLACSYCSPSFSTEWINDIKQHGMYKTSNSDIRSHYSRGIDDNKPVDMNLFWSWFEDIATELESIRITGGEPLLHEETFETFAKMKTVNPKVECVVHTNLCQKPKIIDRFVNSVNYFDNVRINVSNESAGYVAEFIRDGMIYSEWLENLQKICKKTKATVSVSTTITALCLISLDELFLDIFHIRNKLENKPYVSINFATYPVFQSISCLSRLERSFYMTKYQNFYKKHEEKFLDLEKTAFERLIKMLDPSLVDPKQPKIRKDFEIFFKQFIERRNKEKNITELLGIK